MITFSATITKKKSASQNKPPMPLDIPQCPVHAPLSAPKVPHMMSATPKAQSSAPIQNPISKPINEHAFYRFPAMEQLHTETTPMSHPASTHMRAYAALKTAQIQHELIRSRIQKK